MPVILRPAFSSSFPSLLHAGWWGAVSRLCSAFHLSLFPFFPFRRTPDPAHQFAALYNGPWSHAPALADLRQLPVRAWNFSFRVQCCPTSPFPHQPYRSTLLQESIRCRHWAVASWLLLERGLLPQAVHRLSFLDLLATIRRLCRGNATSAFCDSSHHPSLSLLDGLCLMPLPDLCTVVRSFGTIQAIPASLRDLFIATLAFQRYMVLADLDGSRHLLALLPSLDARRLLRLISRDLAIHQGALNPPSAFAPFHHLLASLELRQTLSNTLPPASPSVLPVRPRL